MEKHKAIYVSVKTNDGKPTELQLKFLQQLTNENQDKVAQAYKDLNLDKKTLTKKSAETLIGYLKGE